MLMLMGRCAAPEFPAYFLAHLETAGLDLLALFRAPDRMHSTPEQIPRRLIRQRFGLDAFRRSPVGSRSAPGTAHRTSHAARTTYCRTLQPLARPESAAED